MTDERERMADERERMANEREREADVRESTADARDRMADDRERLANERGTAASARADPEHAAALEQLDELAANRRTNTEQRSRQADRAARSADAAVDHTPGDADWVAERREFVADDRQEQADARQVLADERELLADHRDRHLDYVASKVGTGPAPGQSAEPSASGEQALRDEAAAARDAAALARRIADRDRAASGDAHPLAAEFVKMARSLLQADTAELAMTDVVEAAVRFVNGCDAASFSAYVEDVATTLASTGPVALEVDAAQYQAAEGPCLQAIQTLQLVISADLAHEDRWPAFIAVAPTGVRSVLSSPVSDQRPAATNFGSLNSYGLHANAFDDEDADTAILLTAHLGVLLQLAHTAAEASERAAQLSDAVASRDVIGQAKGILMERERLTAAQAFDVLRSASQRLNRKLRDVADQLATSGEITSRSSREVSP